jgi:osmotically-inducible protein OsmY
MPRLIALLLISFLTVAASGPTATKTAAEQTRPAVSDVQLDSTIRAKLAKSKIGKDGFRFHVQHGVVTWEGNTAVSQHKGAATRMARSSGAVQVVNNIKVNGAGKGTSLRRAYVEP